MRAANWTWGLVFGAALWSTQASASPPWGGVGSREPGYALSALASLTSVGVAAEHHSVLDRVSSVRAAELEVFWTKGVAELRGAKGWHLLGSRRLRLSGVVGLTGLTVLQGPVSFGIGPSVGLFGTYGGGRWEAFLGGQVGAEGFVLADPGVRMPARVMVGGRWPLGPVWLRVAARGGADFAWQQRAVWRGELVLGVGLRLPHVTWVEDAPAGLPAPPGS